MNKPMCFHMFVRTVFAWCVLCTINLYGVNLWAEDTWQPALNVLLTSDDNVTLANEDQIESLLTTVEPSLGLRLKGEGVSFDASYSFIHGDYAGSSEDNFTDHTLKMHTDLSLAQRHGVKVSTELLLLHEGRGKVFSKGLGSTLEKPDEFTNSGLSLEYNYGVPSAQAGLDFRLGYASKDYSTRKVMNNESGLLVDRTQTRDYQGQSYGATYSWRISGRTRMLAEVNANKVEYDVMRVEGSLDSNEVDFVVGATWDITGKSEGLIKVGYRDRDFVSAALIGFTGPRWLARINWTPKTYSKFILTSERKSQESNGFEGFIDQTLLTLDWTHKWSAKMSTTISYDWQKDQYIGVDIEREENQSFISAQFSYAWRRWCYFRVGASGRDVDSTNNIYDYERNVFFAGLGLSF